MPYVMLVYVSNDDGPNPAAWVFGPGERLVGMYRVPARDAHTCPGSCGAHSGFTRDPDFGHEIHGCGYPVPHWRSLIGERLVSALGYNLLDDASTPTVFRNKDQKYRLTKAREDG